MDILIFAVVVILIAILLIMALNAIPNMPEPGSLIVRILILLAAILAIANRAGMI